MITHIYGSNNGVCFQPMTKDGCVQEMPVLITRDAGSTTVFHQGDQTINVPEERLPEFIKAIQKHMKGDA